MKLNKILIIFIFANIFFLNSCESIKNAVTGKKKPPGDEFLVEKKNPLVLPPEFGELPVPLKEEKMEQEAEGCLCLWHASKNRVETKKVIAKGWENEYKRRNRISGKENTRGHSGRDKNDCD